MILIIYKPFIVLTTVYPVLNKVLVQIPIAKSGILKILMKAKQNYLPLSNIEMAVVLVLTEVDTYDFPTPSVHSMSLRLSKFMHFL